MKQQLDLAPTVQATDERRAARLPLLRPDPRAGRASTPTPPTGAALAELNAFNDTEGAWDVVAPDAVRRADAAAGGGLPPRRRLEHQRHAAADVPPRRASSPTSTSSSIRRRRAWRSRTRASSKSRSNARAPAGTATIHCGDIYPDRCRRRPRGRPAGRAARLGRPLRRRRLPARAVADRVRRPAAGWRVRLRCEGAP